MKRAINRPTKGTRQTDGSQPPLSSRSKAGDSAEAAIATEKIDLAAALDNRGQSEVFEAAIRLFRAGNFVKAKELFQQAAKGPIREVAHSARLHTRICERRLARPEVALRTADDHYDYAVTLINERQLEPAEQHLHRALAQAPRADHLYYALALCRGLGGDLEGAYSYMKRAIELQPRNRAMARNDPDFAEIGQQPPLSELLYPERKKLGTGYGF